MHVLGLTDHLSNVGGAEISARTILVGLADHEDVDRVTVIGVKDPTVSKLEFEGVDVIPVDPPPHSGSLPDFVVDLIIERRLACAARSHASDADVIHAHHRQSALGLARLDPATPTVATVRDFWPICPISIYHIDGQRCTGCEDCLDDCVAHQGWDGFAESGVKMYLLAKRRHQRPVLAAFDSTIFIADHIRERLTGAVKFPEHTGMIYNPVEVDNKVEPAQFHSPTFVTASSLSESKGIETVIRAMPDVIETLPDAKLIVFGDGPRREELESLAAELETEAIEFRGRVDPSDVYASMAGATATVFPSVWDEPFGRVTIESMMLGTPVVGSDVGGIAEIIDNERTGLLFPPEDVTTLSRKLCTLAQNKRLREDIVSSAKAASRRFRTDRATESHINHYQSLVE